MKIAIVGAGICGLSTAKALTNRGHQVTLFEQFELFHNRGSSHGASRIVRRAYPDPFYTACMTEAYPMWSDLEQESGKRLVTECGLLYFGERDSTNIQSVVKGLSDLQVPHEIRDSNSVQTLLPELRLDGSELAIWTPEAGWVDAAETLRTLHGLATAKGLKTLACTKADPVQLSETYDYVVVTAGPWSTDHAPLPVTRTLQTFAYSQAQIAGPVWIEDSDDFVYGFPSDAIGQKVGLHRSGPVIDPDKSEREPSQDVMETLGRSLLKRFGLKDASFSHQTTCVYTSTINEDFLLGRLAENVVFATACSGHGFKMGLWMGRILADCVEGQDSPDQHPRFCWPTQG